MHSLIRYFSVLLFGLITQCLQAQQLKLFSLEQREVARKTDVMVMDFLERYFTNLPKVENTTLATKLADDKVFFRKGRLSDLALVSDTMPVSISLVNRYYEVAWGKQEEPFLTIVFPAQYDLILGQSQEEAQRNLKDMILAAPQRNDSIVIPKGKTRLDSKIFVSKTAYLELENFNDATYYTRAGAMFKPYFNAEHPDYSAANLFHGLINNANYRLYIEQSVYGLKSVSYTLPFSKWLDYCAEWRMKIYFAVEEEREDGMLVLVVAENRELGFNHMLSVVIPDKFMTKPDAVLKAKFTSYIPTHNIKNLFQQESVNHRKKEWQ